MYYQQPSQANPSFRAEEGPEVTGVVGQINHVLTVLPCVYEDADLSKCLDSNAAKPEHARVVCYLLSNRILWEKDKQSSCSRRAHRSCCVVIGVIHAQTIRVFRVNSSLTVYINVTTFFLPSC